MARAISDDAYARLLEVVRDIQAHFPTQFQTNIMSMRFDTLEAIINYLPSVPLPTADDCINTVILALARPEAGEHDPFLAAKTSFAVTAVQALVNSKHLTVKGGAE